GVTVPEGNVANSSHEAVSIAATVGGPVALKVSHPDVKHKTELGGVVLGLIEPTAIEAAADQLLALMPDGLVLVEAMVDPGVEMLVAATRDGVVPSLVVGFGGIWTELLDDVAVIPLPADVQRIRTAVQRLRGFTLLSGGRGQSALAVDALYQLAQNVGEVLLREKLSLVELNPVIISQTAAVAVDAVIQK
ncbi:MAG: acetate--CoA ligase family protein, partial [Candidatus Nanopelagicales bacterium]